MPKILLLVPQRNFNDTEFTVTRNALEIKGCEVTIASITKDEALSMEGGKIKPDIELRLANPNNYDAFVLIGGSGTPQLLDYPEVISTVKKFNEQEKLIAAICLAPIILAQAGILVGVLSTVYPADFAIKDLKDGGASYSEMHVIKDGNIITADGPEVAQKFVNEILKEFNF
jgi:protease I